MRRAALSLVIASVLAACSTGTPAEVATVAGGFGEPPTVTFPEIDPPQELRVDVVSEGNGEVVSPGDFLVADYIGQVWGAASPFNDSFAAGQVAGFSLDGVIGGWQEGLPGTHVGDRVMLTIPPDLGYPEGNPGAGIAAGETLVFVIDVLAAFSQDELAGQPDATDTGLLAGLPVTVTGALGAPATVQVLPDREAPTELAITTIAAGTGTKVTDAGSVVVSFAAAGWDGTDGGSTWDAGTPEVIPLGLGTLFDGLVGVPVGSRVIALIPASGDTPALAAVIDVIGQAA